MVHYVRSWTSQSRPIEDGTQTATVGHGIKTFGHEEIAALANELWRARGCPQGSPEEDWFRAAEQLRARVEVR